MNPIDFSLESAIICLEIYREIKVSEIKDFPESVRRAWELGRQSEMLMLQNGCD